jgi:hypothetical protein
MLHAGEDTDRNDQEGGAQHQPLTIEQALKETLRFFPVAGGHLLRSHPATIVTPNTKAMALHTNAITPAMMPQTPLPDPPNIAAVRNTMANTPATKNIPLNKNHAHAVI